MKILRQGLLAILLSVVAGLCVWFLILEQATPNADYSLIEDDLYVGARVPEPPPGTKAVLNLCERKDPYKVDIHRWESIRDGPPAPSLDWLREMVQFVDTQHRAGITTYVHCGAGISRSAMVVTAYLMYRHRWSRDKALAFVRSKRPQVQPNRAFMQLLTEWEQALEE